MADVIIIAILIVALGAAVYSIWKNKKEGNHCAGCPHAGSCIGQDRCRDK